MIPYQEGNCIISLAKYDGLLTYNNFSTPRLAFDILYSIRPQFRLIYAFPAASFILSSNRHAALVQSGLLMTQQLYIYCQSNVSSGG